MDTVTDFLSKLPDGALTVKNFIVAGASKRAWTTWTTAAVDPRVAGIAPIVIDTLNIPQVFQHTYQAYGFWPPAVQDYVNMGIMNWFGTPQMDALMEIEDPYRYRARLALPTYAVNATGDQFFVPDSPRFYFADMPGEKYLRFVPNTDHYMQSPDALIDLIAWFNAIAQNPPRPRFYWRADPASGTMTVRTVDTPTQVMLWQASNPAARDFRLETLGPAWTSTPLTGTNGIYTVLLPPPAAGYNAFFVELDFGPLAFTTEVVITPDVYPFSPPVSTSGTSAGFVGQAFYACPSAAIRRLLA